MEFCTFNNQRTTLSPSSNVNVSQSIIGKTVNDTLVAPAQKWMLMEQPLFLAVHFGKSKVGVVPLTHNQTIGPLSAQKDLGHKCYYIQEMLVKGVLMMCVHRSWEILGLCGDVIPQLNYWPAFYTKILAITWLVCPKKEHQQSIRACWYWILEYWRAVRWHFP